MQTKSEYSEGSMTLQQMKSVYVSGESRPNPSLHPVPCLANRQSQYLKDYSTLIDSESYESVITCRQNDYTDSLISQRLF